MTRRRLATVAALVIALGAAGASQAHAVGPVSTAGSGDYIACVAVDEVNVGTCLRDPVRPVVNLLP